MQISDKDVESAMTLTEWHKNDTLWTATPSEPSSNGEK